MEEEEEKQTEKKNKEEEGENTNKENEKPIQMAAGSSSSELEEERKKDGLLGYENEDEGNKVDDEVAEEVHATAVATNGRTAAAAVNGNGTAGYNHNPQSETQAEEEYTDSLMEIQRLVNMQNLSIRGSF